jgi:hypothetical protein
MDDKQRNVPPLSLSLVSQRQSGYALRLYQLPRGRSSAKIRRESFDHVQFGGPSYL